MYDNYIIHYYRNGKNEYENPEETPNKPEGKVAYPFENPPVEL
jgi:hypothetical protein